MNDNFDYLMHIYESRKSEFQKTSRPKLEDDIERDLRRVQESLVLSSESLTAFSSLMKLLSFQKSIDNSFSSKSFRDDEELCIAELKESFK